MKFDEFLGQRVALYRKEFCFVWRGSQQAMRGQMDWSELTPGCGVTSTHTLIGRHRINIPRRDVGQSSDSGSSNRNGSSARTGKGTRKYEHIGGTLASSSETTSAVPPSVNCHDVTCGVTKVWSGASIAVNNCRARLECQQPFHATSRGRTYFCRQCFRKIQNACQTHVNIHQTRRLQR
jgi:hypothetical protein